MLSVKTKRGSLVEDKPKIYFCCHPADLESCIQLLSEDIFAVRDCAIYYETDEETFVDLKERSVDLEEMRLFVIPITARFLMQESRARSFEYGFAVERHIPVLPVLMEPGLANAFSKVMNRMGAGYGDIQFLDRTSSDTTEIPYEQKLRQRLESVLIGNELAERVRAAFDAYIFLSYRKKDRIYAKELMRMIHKIPFCRDIAIWYDEYLVPGEAWNTAIAEAMTNSALMVMAVTPNITEPGNYVVKHEYPNARRSNKSILPAELLPTDMAVLREMFPGIPQNIDGKDSVALAAALKEALKEIAIQGNENKEHNYLIGLAYLGGIDVERNTDRALALITDAAEHDLPEAVEKLAQMYYNGDGVLADLETAIEWQSKLTVLFMTQYEKEKTEPAWFRWTGAVFTLHRYLADLQEREISDNEQMKTGIFQLKEAVLGQVVESGNCLLAEKKKEAFQGSAVGQTVSFASDLLARIYMDAGELEKAESILVQSEPSPEQFLRLGELSEKQKRYMQAEKYYDRALECSRKEQKEGCEARALHRLAVLAEMINDLIRADQYYQAELKIREKMRDEKPSLETIEDEAIVHYHLGTMKNGKNRLEHLRQAHQLYGFLTKQFPENGRLRKNHAMIAGSLNSLQQEKQTVRVDWSMLPIMPQDIKGHKGGKEKMGLFGNKKPKVSQEELKKQGEFAMAVDIVKRKNDPAAMYVMANMLMQGVGTPKDTEKAVYWFRKSAEMGYSKSAYALALEYAMAEFMPFDAENAKKWAKIALDMGDERGQKILDALQQ